MSFTHIARLAKDSTRSPNQLKHLDQLHLAAIGRPAWNKGKMATETALRNQSAAHIGQKAWNKGVPMTEEARQKLSQAKRGQKPPNCKKVRCIETGEVFASAGDASRALNLRQGGITAVCRGEYKSTGGFTFRFVD